MTDKEIIKALECCTPTNESCLTCPLIDVSVPECAGILYKATIDLINRQQAEVERLRKANGLLEYVTKAVHHVKIGGEDWTIDFKTKEAMFEEINKKIDTLCNIQTSRAEAIKECLNWVLSLFPEDKNFTTISRFTVNQKIKEMVGEENDNR